METSIDYRNAKYQGETNESQTRNGFGILVDDDLSLYASHWKDGKLNDSTMIYISHGKYIYGLWRDNQPHGLNVFRIGDTIVLGEFDNGYLIKKIVIIFEKFNFVATLSEKDGDWTVQDRDVFRSYSQLVKYIEQSSIPMKPQYFSLTKYLTSMANEKVHPVPCLGSENCYYGFQQGLGIVFNVNNGVVSVGSHENKKLTDFGGKYDSNRSVTQGNFLTNQTIKYSQQRPKQQIYSIFQKIHKRSLNFRNEYFDSKVKLLTHIEEMIRGKIEEIVYQKQGANQNTITALDLNDSLDYHYQNLEFMNRMNNKSKQEVYQVQIPMKKVPSYHQQASPRVNQKKILPVTPTKKNLGLITNAPASPLYLKKSPFKNKQKQQMQKQKQIERMKQKQRYKERERQIEKLKKQPKTPTKKNIQKFYNEQSFTNREAITRSIRADTKNSEQKLTKSPYQTKYQIDHLSQFDQNAQVQQLLVSSKDYIRQKESYNVPSFKYSYSQTDKSLQNYAISAKSKLQYKMGGSQKLQRVQKAERMQKTEKIESIQRQNRAQRIDNVEWIQSSGSRLSTSPINMNKKISQNPVSPNKPPCYENLSDRRKRLLKQFKNLNNVNEPVGSAISKVLPTSIIKTFANNVNNTNIVNNSNNMNNLNNVNNGNNVNNVNSTNHASQNKTKCNYEYMNQMQSPCARQKLPYYASKNTQQSQTLLPLTICKMNNQSSNGFSKKKQHNELGSKEYLLNLTNQKQKPTYHPEIKMSQKSSFKQNIDSSDMDSKIKPFEKKQSYYDKISKNLEKPFIEKSQIECLTPTRRKQYKYYFDE